MMQAPPSKPTSTAPMNTTTTTVVLYVVEMISNDGIDEVVPVAFGLPKTVSLPKQKMDIRL